MGLMKEFKAFALRGNVMDLAVGVLIGAAFSKIVTALVDDLLMPLVGMFGDGKKFTDKFYVLRPSKTGVSEFKSLAEARAAGANVLAYGDFIQVIVDFIIIAFCIFMVIKVINRLKAKQEAGVVAAISHTDQLLTEIRDELKKPR